ncbi:MAG: Mth938-like domain-containing protein [Rubrobacter sp.]|nr:Mth938-like domain-containing protein [Rubrobacter sp.]
MGRKMTQEARSPRVTHVSWGRLETEDGAFKDAKLFPGGAKEWDWKETGTRHEPGVQSADVEELLEHGATVVVLSKGFHERLRVMGETLRMLEDKGIAVYVEQTEEAVRLYNELGKNERVGALIHSTC